MYRPYSAASEINEAITESEIITKVLAQLGWSDLWLPQVTASGSRREDVPDFLLYPDEVAKAHSLKEKRDDRRYRRGIAILEAKRWMHSNGQPFSPSFVPKSSGGTDSAVGWPHSAKPNVFGAGRVKISPFRT